MRFLFFLILFGYCFCPKINAQDIAIEGGHSHNDYHHTRPLLSALDAKLVSIEADVFPRNGTLLVGHSVDELKSNRSLTNLYLKPLYKLYKAGKLDTIILMIDIKEEGEASYKILKEKVAPYQDMLSVYYPDRIEKKTVSIILSGNRPWSLLAEDKRVAALDGRFDSISFKLGYTYFPMISSDWHSHFDWRGQGKPSAEEKKTLDQMVQRCHNQSKMIRFWNTAIKQPNAQNFWLLLIDSKVDLQGVDNPMEYRKFISTRHSKKIN